MPGKRPSPLSRRLDWKGSDSPYSDAIMETLELYPTCLDWGYHLGCQTKPKQGQSCAYFIARRVFRDDPEFSKPYRRNPRGFERRVRAHVAHMSKTYQAVKGDIGNGPKTLDRVKSRYPWWDWAEKVWGEFEKQLSVASVDDPTYIPSTTTSSSSSSP
ncbi:hypothetical protein SISNIDRAFT_469323 [Sistotremastrum niveocremeum HHB9708]|uniref:Uncharacterized protein n=1 Tax=Sistotremastrum niveocremeum HHB9708 TaxID=1314777 RepID=A0A164QDR2_9AGAM|nr:hypothetical protein SISNIDRAFT_469323 [Sistotremastrum niveocremeum HHB9708]